MNEKGDERERTSNWKRQSDFTSNMSMLIMTEKHQHTRIDVPSSNPRQYSYRVSYDRFRQACTSCKHDPPVAICSHAGQHEQRLSPPSPCVKRHRMESCPYTVLYNTSSAIRVLVAMLEVLKR